jgi:hypothetical protein
MRPVIAFALLIGMVAAAAAQPAPPPAASPPAPIKPDTPPVDCRGQASAKGLSGQAMRDAVALCREEQRTACLKEAINKHIVGKERKAFVKDCSRRPKDGQPAKT